MEEPAIFGLNDLPDDVLGHCIFSRVLSNENTYVKYGYVISRDIALVSRRFRDLSRKVLTGLTLDLTPSVDPKLTRFRRSIMSCFGSYPALSRLRVHHARDLTRDILPSANTIFASIPTGLKSLDIRGLGPELLITPSMIERTFASLEELSIDSDLADRWFASGRSRIRVLTISATSRFAGADLSIPCLRKLSISAKSGTRTVQATIPVGLEELSLNQIDVVGWTNTADLRILDLQNSDPGGEIPPMPALDKLTLFFDRDELKPHTAQLIRAAADRVRDLNLRCDCDDIPDDIFNGPRAFTRTEKLELGCKFVRSALAALRKFPHAASLKSLTAEFADAPMIILSIEPAVFPALESVYVFGDHTDDEGETPTIHCITIDHPELREFSCCLASIVALARAPRLRTMFADTGCHLTFLDRYVYGNLRNLTCQLTSAVNLAPNAFPSLAIFHVLTTEPSQKLVSDLFGTNVNIVNQASDSAQIDIDTNLHSRLITIHSKSAHLRLTLCRQDDTDLRIKCVGRPKTIDISQNTTKDHEKIELTRLSTDISLLADVRELTSMRWNVMATFPVDLIYDTLATLSKLHLLSRSYVEEFGTVSLPNLRKIKMTFYEFYPREYKFVVPNLRKFTAKDHVARVPQTVRLLGANTGAVIFRQCGQCLVTLQN